MRSSYTFIALSFCLYLGLILSVWAMPAGKYVLILTDPNGALDHPFSVIAEAGGTFVAGGRFSWMTVGHSDEANFPARLREAGALLVLNHQLAVGCLEGNKG